MHGSIEAQKCVPGWCTCPIDDYVLVLPYIHLASTGGLDQPGMVVLIKISAIKALVDSFVEFGGVS